MSKASSYRIGFAEPLHDPEDALIDIVFVHGLRGHRESTWMKDNTLWPRDLLPKKIPRARILTFGYDADVYHFWSKPASENTIKDHGNNLTASLVGLRLENDKTATRPIIFVAHSLGGLVCAEALSTAEESLVSDTKLISTYTRRMAFLGTPHQGSDKAKWVDVGKRFLDMFYQKTTADILKELGQGSDTLVKLGVAFPKWLSHQAEKPETKVEIVCFFEELSFTIGGKSIGKIVSEDSARLLDYPTLSIHADHTGMCKFSDEKDGNYQKVAEVLERWAKELKDAKVEDDASSPKIKNNVTFGDNNEGNQVGILKSSGQTNFGSGGTFRMGSP